MEYDLFISYSRKDRLLVHDFVLKLQNKGFSVWIDWDGLKNGDKFKAEIVKAIEGSKIVLFFSSINSNSSEWVQKEISIASDRQKKIIPIKIDNAPYDENIEMDLTLLDFVDFTVENECQIVFNKLVRSLWINISLITNENVDIYPLSKAVTPNESKHVNRYVRLLLICVIIILLAIWLGPKIDHFLESYWRRYDANTSMVENTARRDSAETVLYINSIKNSSIKKFGGEQYEEKQAEPKTKERLNNTEAGE